MIWNELLFKSRKKYWDLDCHEYDQINVIWIRIKADSGRQILAKIFLKKYLCRFFFQKLKLASDSETGEAFSGEPSFFPIHAILHYDLYILH